MVDLPRLAASSPALDTRQRLRAFIDMWFVDHGFIRDIYWNLHQVSPLLWRSAQPAPRHLRQAKKMGIQTVLNLRGRREGCGSYLLERQACSRLGLTLIDFPLRSRGPLEKPTLHAIGELFQTLKYPVLLHCKSGADRAGLMATLYLFLHEGVPLRQAMAQLSWRYGHIKQARTGIVDHLFETYLADTSEQPLAFFDWVDRSYDPERLMASFRAQNFARLLVDAILRRE